MNSVSKTNNSRIQRCAVSKIDLKGRFVYIDDESARLFDSTKEDLFGHFFVDYVSEEDKEIIESIVSLRNHYESFYDSAQISIKTAKGQYVTVDIIASLNFIAGNPVNFQFIMHSSSVSKNISDRTSTGRNDSGLIETCASLIADFEKMDFLSLAESIKQLTGIEQVGVYMCDNNSIEAAYDFDSVNLQKLPALSKIHSLVAGDKFYFSAFDDNDVRWAIEQTGQVPNEYLFAVNKDDLSILFRIVLPEAMKDKRIIAACEICSAILCRKADESVKAKDDISAKNILKEFDTLKLSLNIHNGNIKIEEHKNNKKYIITCPADSEDKQ